MGGGQMKTQGLTSRLKAFITGIACFFLVAGSVQANESVTLVRPAVENTVIAKKPDFECLINISYDPASLYIELDYTDMTALADISDTGFTLTPIQVLSPGEHTLMVSFSDESGQETVKEFRFTTRHTETFEKAVSENAVSVNYSNVLEKTGDPMTQNLASWSLSSNLNSRTTLSEGPLTLGLNTNVRYLDQQTAIQEPEEKGPEIVNYQFTGLYEKDSTRVWANIGDVNIDYTQNTVSGLGRRGAHFGFGLGPLESSGFVVRSDQAYGIDGDSGLHLDNADHIYGAMAGLKLFQERLTFKTVYATGGESASDTSYGIWPEPGGTTGEGMGFEITTDFFEQAFRTRMEYDWSDYDSDVADNAGSAVDKAWLVQIDGQIDLFNYEALYEHTGPDYQIPGNSGSQTDWEGFTVSAGANFEKATIGLRYDQHNNNVNERPDEAKLTSNEMEAYLSVMPYETLSLEINGRRSIQNSTKEPPDTYETKTYTDTLGGLIQYAKDELTVGLEPSYSYEDDQTADDYDTSNGSVRVFCDWSTDRFTFSPSVTGSRYTDLSSQVKTDTWAAEIQFCFNIIQGLSLNGNLGYSKNYTDNDAVDTDDYNANIQLEYEFDSPIKGFLSPYLCLRLTHENSTDEIEDTHNKETIIYLLLSADLDLSF